MTPFRIRVATLLSVLLFLAIPAGAGATQIGLNFVGGSTVNGTPATLPGSERAGYAPQRFWNNLLGGSGSSSLQADAGAELAAYFAGLSASWSDTYGTRSTPITDLAGDNRLMKGYLNTDNTPGGAATVTVTGIPFTSGYAVIVYFDGDNGPADRVTKITLSAAGFGTRTVYGLDKLGVDFNGIFKPIPASSSTDQGGSTPGGNCVLFSVLTDTSFTVTVNGASASDGNSRGALNALQIVDLDSLPASGMPVITSPGTATGTVGVPFSYTITADNAATNFNATGLPAGLSVNRTTGLISGTPTAGGVFSVQLSAHNSAGTGTKTLTLTISGGTTGAPANDDFANGTVLSGLPLTVTGNNTNATKETGEPNHAAHLGGKSVWWTWTAPVSGAVAITTLGSSFDTLLAVYTGSAVSGLTLVAGNDDFYSDHTSMLVIPNVTSGTTYHIAVDGYGAAAGSIVLSLTRPPSVSLVTPANHASYSAPANITLSANASDPDGTIQWVAYYTNDNLAGWSATAPYSLALTNAGAGAYTVLALAADERGGATYSSAISFWVNTNGFTAAPLDTGATNRLCDVVMLNSQVGYSGGFNGMLLVTFNGGATWTRLNSGSTNTINAVQVAGPDLFLAGDNGLLRVSHDGGQSWISVYIGSAVNLYTASLISPYFGFAAGANGTIYAYNGSGWSQQSSGATADIYGIVAIGTNGYAVGANGTICRYDGSRWVVQNSGTTSVNFYGVAFYNSNCGYAVGAGGAIRKTTNGGTNWVAQASGVTNTLRKVYVLDLNTAWCVGDGGVVLQTTNGGSSWVVVRSGGTDLTGIDFIDGRGFLVGPGGAAYDFYYQPVGLNQPPSVWLNSPASGAVFYVGSTINLSAGASDSSGISKVEFYQGSTLLGTRTGSPYTLAWSGAAAGSYSLTVVAYDNQGAHAWSSPVSLTVIPAVDLAVSLTVSPARITLTNTAVLTLVVTNRGPSSATGVQLKSIMPSAFDFSAASLSQGSYIQSGNTLWASLGTLPSGSTATLTLTLTPAGAIGTWSHYATVTANEAEVSAANNTAILPITIAPLSFGYAGAGIVIRDANSASAYPATLLLSGLSGVVSKLTVTLTNLTHSYTRDLDLLLVGPAGQSVLLMSDCGGKTSAVANVTFTFDDSAAGSLSSLAPLSSGTFRPTNFAGNDGGNEVFPAPAPAGPYGSSLSVFNGTNPNGAWSLYILDDETYDSGSLGGWSLSIGTVSAEPAPTLTLNRSGSNDLLKWPSASTGFKVQTATDLAWPVSWTNLTQAAAVLNGQNVMTNANSGAARFYRLRKP